MCSVIDAIPRPDTYDHFYAIYFTGNYKWDDIVSRGKHTGWEGNEMGEYEMLGNELIKSTTAN